MDFEIPEETRQLRDAVRRFIEREIKPLDEQIKEEDDIPLDLITEARRRGVAAGFYGMYMPEEVGGGGLDLITTVLVFEDIAGQGSRMARFALGAHGGPTPILLACNEEQRERFLMPVMRGEKTNCFALTEPGAGSDAAAIQTTAVKDGDNYVLNGVKHFITNGPYADFAMVYAVTDKTLRARGGVTCFLVEKGTPGFSVARVQKTMSGDNLQAELAFEDCVVPSENILGEAGQGFLLAMQWIGHGRLLIGAMCVGVAEHLLKMSTDYAKQRVQFGKPIASKQAIQWMLADSATEIYASRMMLYNAAWKAEQGENIIKETSMVKLYATEMVNRVADRALQIHGGMGYMREFPIERIFREVRVLRIVEGTSEIQRFIISRFLLNE
ncbi:MAG: acyl-CoA dehydrogenase family protein [Candidatus Hydrogenedentota bacterium]|nr:MAG: acyl-CoA dehydrogenase family protein [Candidatus Hydrogenedentota bacterium]